MGKCASKQELHHRELLHQQYNWNDKSNGRNSRSSVSEQSIFLLIENEVISFYQVTSYFIRMQLFRSLSLHDARMKREQTNEKNKEKRLGTDEATTTYSFF